MAFLSSTVEPPNFLGYNYVVKIISTKENNYNEVSKMR